LKQKINLLDASWLAIDSEDTPMHVGNLQIYSLPEGASDTFLRDDVIRMKAAGEIVSPWNKKLTRPGFLGRILMPTWSIDDDIDLDYHVRHSALPKPGGERELGMLVSRLHSHRMDFKRPLWECHVIEGLENNRFAIYTKLHHSLIDGVSGVRLLERTLSDTADTETMPPWSIGQAQKSSADKPAKANVLIRFIQGIKRQIAVLPLLMRALGKLISSGIKDNQELSVPFVGPRSAINGRVRPARRFATQKYSLENIKQLATATDSSLNDIVLYLCSTAMRNFLIEHDSLPEKPLTSGIPVNIRPADDTGTGTAISFIIADLATNEADPLKRLEIIKQSTKVAKDHLQSMPRSALMQYTLFMMAPYTLQLLSGLGGRMRPAFNVTISNVPGPSKPLFYNGCELEAMYPVSLIAHGGALNITCLSYNGALNFGYTGCRDTLPSMQNIAVLSGEALEELEGLVNK
jgi:WS/DGAT/MGAT family acyltransferase